MRSCAGESRCLEGRFARLVYLRCSSARARVCECVRVSVGGQARLPTRTHANANAAGGGPPSLRGRDWWDPVHRRELTKWRQVAKRRELGGGFRTPTAASKGRVKAERWSDSLSSNGQAKAKYRSLNGRILVKRRVVLPVSARRVDAKPWSSTGQVPAEARLAKTAACAGRLCWSGLPRGAKRWRA